MLSLLTNPLIILAGGGFLLLTGSFIYREKKSDVKVKSSGRKKNLSDRSEPAMSGETGTIAEVSKDFWAKDPGTESQVHRLEILEKRLEEKEKRLNALLEAAENTADRLSRMIIRFEKTFYSPETKTQVTAGLMTGLKEEINGELNQWEQSLQNESPLPDSDDLPRKFSINSQNERQETDNHPQFHFEPFSIRSIELTDSPKSADSDKGFDLSEAVNSPVRRNDPAADGVIDSEEQKDQNPASGMSRIEKSKAIRRLLKQKKSNEEIALELDLDLSEVEVIVNVLNGQWKAA